MEELWQKLPPLTGPQDLLRLRPLWSYGRLATYNLFRREDLPVIRFGKKVLIVRENLRHWFETGGRLS